MRAHTRAACAHGHVHACMRPGTLCLAYAHRHASARACASALTRPTAQARPPPSRRTRTRQAPARPPARPHLHTLTRPLLTHRRTHTRAGTFTPTRHTLTSHAMTAHDTYTYAPAPAQHLRPHIFSCTHTRTQANTPTRAYTCVRCVCACHLNLSTSLWCRRHKRPIGRQHLSDC